MIAEMDTYLESTDIIDWKSTSVMKRARSLSGVHNFDTAKNCFLYVREVIPHCCDISATAIPLKASEVLVLGTGLCYAKSHLLAALLRANGIPAGFGYVRLAEPRTASGFALHGFNWVFLKEHGWFRIDARGNNGKVSTGFRPPDEFLAYYPEHEGEFFFEENFTRPIAAVVEAYRSATNFESLLRGLPDVI